MNAPPLSATRYLANRAVNGPWRIDGNDRDDFRMAIVIPVLAETASLPATLASLAENPSERLTETLVLVVVNQRPDSNAADKSDNRLTLKLLTDGAFSHLGLQLAWVDAASDGRQMPQKDGGVGLARKIGFDLALARLDYRRQDPLLIALDADTLVSADYLDAWHNHFQTAKAGAAVMPFCHQQPADREHQAAIARYELFLRAHVLGLELAGSPYAFHTVGSTMACRASAYAGVGGMNRRQAGEDFYFLQQMIKTVGLMRATGTVVFPSARISARTPFGTGQSVQALLEGQAEAVLFYPTECYRLLGEWLSLVDMQWAAEGVHLLQESGRLDPLLKEFLGAAGFSSLWDRLAKNHPGKKGRIKAFHDWFDGLKTIRLIHHLCSGPYPRCDPGRALPSLLKWAGLPPAENLFAQLNVLRDYQAG